MDTKEKHFLTEIEDLIVAVSAILLIFAAFLTWGETSRFATSGLVGDGVITIAIGVVAIVLLIIDIVYHVSAWIPLFLGAIALVVGGIDFYAMFNAVEKFSGKVGMGLYLTVIASAGIILGAIIDLVRNR